ncbi:MAG: hypothetical protein CMF48_02225 [Legionellales bacterium]|nr:hypothetical protein [Legionellales bacterium]|tara:strand:+ start:396 stop:584 length:189 start_codon:yes stop_codon:yes gene_type:complete
MKIFGKHGVPKLSELDQFMTEFNDKRTVEDASRMTEAQKHEKLFKKRDKKMSPDDTKIWEGF